MRRKNHFWKNFDGYGGLTGVTQDWHPVASGNNLSQFSQNFIMFSLRDLPSLNVMFNPAGGREGEEGVTQHWWVEDMGSSQLEQFTNFSTGTSAFSLILTGVNIRGAGEGKFFTL